MVRFMDIGALPGALRVCDTLKLPTALRLEKDARLSLGRRESPLPGRSSVWGTPCESGVRLVSLENARQKAVGSSREVHDGGRPAIPRHSVVSHVARLCCAVPSRSLSRARSEAASPRVRGSTCGGRPNHGSTFDRNQHHEVQNHEGLT